MAIHVSLGFAQFTGSGLSNFAVGVINGLTANAAVFPNPSVSVASLTAAQKAFDSALATANGGGVQQTIVKDASHDALVGLLRQEALYVQQLANGDPSKILLAGFQTATAGHSPQAPMPKAVILQIINETSGQLLVRLQSIPNAHAYEGQLSTDGGVTWQAAGIYSQARRIVVPNLTPGKNYTFRFRAIGGSTGSGDWSDPVSHMAM
jgi:hypothetical protein